MGFCYLASPDQGSAIWGYPRPHWAQCSNLKFSIFLAQPSAASASASGFYSCFQADALSARCPYTTQS